MAMFSTISLAIGIFLIIAVALNWKRFSRRSFESRLPPLSDDEFVKRCGPNTDRDIALRVRRIVADRLGAEYERIHPSSSFVHDLGAD